MKRLQVGRNGCNRLGKKVNNVLYLLTGFVFVNFFRPHSSLVEANVYLKSYADAAEMHFHSSLT